MPDNKKEKKNVNEKTDSVNVSFSNDLFIVCNNNEINLINYETTWVLGNRTSQHVTSIKENLLSYTSCDFGVVKRWRKTICMQSNTRFSFDSTSSTGCAQDYANTL